MANQYRKEGNKLYFTFSYNQSIINSLKELDPKDRKFDPIGKQWVVQYSILNQRKVKDIIDEYGFCLLNDGLEKESQENSVNDYLLKKSRLNLVKSYEEEIKKIESKITPRPFQVTGINHQCSWPKMINGDDMGTGKSIQTIFSAEVTNRFPCLLICPSSVKYQWVELWRRVNPNRTFSIIEAADKNKDWSTDVVIINYDIIGKKNKYIDELGEEKWKAVAKYPEIQSREWNYIVFDEIHYLKSYKSLRSKAAQLIANKIPNRHGLTGTLVENKPVDIVNPLMLIGVFNEIFGSWDNFTERYCDAKDTRFGRDVSGASNTLELNKILSSTCYIHREKRDVLDDLPPIQTSVLNIDIDNKRAYKQAEDDFIDYLTNNYSAIEVDNARNAEYLVQRNHLRQLSLKGKSAGIIDWLEDFTENTREKALVVGNFTEVLLDLSIQFDAELINGDMDAKEKREAIKKWNKDKKKQFMFAGIKAVGTGTDGLQENCSTLVILDLPDKPSVVDQLVSRLERMGQKNSIFVYFLLNRETIDMRLWEAIGMKREVTEAINKGKVVQMIDVDKLIMLSYLKRK